MRTNLSGEHISYTDSLGYLTGGYGHLMTDAEKQQYPEGTTIPDEVVDKWFQEDMKEAQQAVETLAPDVPEEIKNILTNMAFNLGQNRLSGFKKMLAAVKAGDYDKAADEMKDSKWYTQVGNRSKRLVERMRDL